jgi:hypothetical protein
MLRNDPKALANWHCKYLDGLSILSVCMPNDTNCYHMCHPDHFYHARYCSAAGMGVANQVRSTIVDMPSFCSFAFIELRSAAFLLIQFKFEPFEQRVDNWLQTLCLSVLFLVYFHGTAIGLLHKNVCFSCVLFLFFLTGLLKKARVSEDETKTFDVVLTGTFILVIVLFVLVGLYRLYNYLRGDIKLRLIRHSSMKEDRKVSFIYMPTCIIHLLPYM